HSPPPPPPHTHKHNLPSDVHTFIIRRIIYFHFLPNTYLHTVIKFWWLGPKQLLQKYWLIQFITGLPYLHVCSIM
ncbi:MAG: hypothetical protein MJE68_07260, partial [Proteobacteria bacterium]|nr:hypothetical protein [Pseudomonadota bacterium]